MSKNFNSMRIFQKFLFLLTSAERRKADYCLYGSDYGNFGYDWYCFYNAFFGSFNKSKIIETNAILKSYMKRQLYLEFKTSKNSFSLLE